MMFRCLILLMALWAVAPGVRAASSVVQTDQVRAELLAHAPQGLMPGQPLWLGLRIQHQPHWHTYWKNPGDSGLPTTLEWQLPAGFAAGDIAWPTPRALRVGPLMNYGYEGTVLLAVAVSVPSDFSGDRLTARLTAQWLVCKDVCIPEAGDFELTVPARAASVAHAAAFDAARATLPRTLAGASAMAQVSAAGLALRAQGLPAAWAGQPLQFFPEVAGIIDNAAVAPTAWAAGEWTAGLALSPQRSERPSVIPAVLALAGADQPGVRVQVSVSGSWPASAPPTAPAVAPDAPAAPVSWLMAVGLAMLGGMLLNLMPCVFPVLSLKLIAATAHGASQAQAVRGALAYAAGVVLSFVVLAGVLLALRAGGEQLGWGFQLQSPVFVAALALLFAAIGLNLVGVLSFGPWLSGGVIGSLAGVRLRHPVADSALTGVLAVVVASPCTAPFMGASLGAASTLPAAQALSVFAALGLGMAAPFVALCLWPALSRRLPRPGPWMVRFKVLMAFPMFATVVWLMWVLGQQSGVDAVAALLGTLVATAFAAWSLGASGFAGRARYVAGSVAALALWATLSWAWPSLRSPTAQIALPDSGSAWASSRWQPWTPEVVGQALDQGRPVFVDFTAAWCVTCQFNKRTVLADEQVLADFEAKRVLLLRADWTRRDAAITQALARLGRNGVPVYLLQAPGGAPPRLLSELLSVAEVRAALAALP